MRLRDPLWMLLGDNCPTCGVPDCECPDDPGPDWDARADDWWKHRDDEVRGGLHL